MKHHGGGGGQGRSSCKGSRRLTLMSIIGFNNALYLLSYHMSLTVLLDRNGCM